MVTSLFGTRPPPTSIELTHRTSNHPRGQAAWPVAAQCTTSWRSGQHIVVKLFYGKGEWRHKTGGVISAFAAVSSFAAM